MGDTTQKLGCSEGKHWWGRLACGCKKCRRCGKLIARTWRYD